MKTKAELIRERDQLARALKDGYITTNEYQSFYHNLSEQIKEAK